MHLMISKGIGEYYGAIVEAIGAFKSHFDIISPSACLCVRLLPFYESLNLKHALTYLSLQFQLNENTSKEVLLPSKMLNHLMKEYSHSMISLNLRTMRIPEKASVVVLANALASL